jgi:transketolase N-terminal domain/subunit
MLGMIYLRDNPLLREPLRAEHVKNRPLGHWGSSPGLAFIYVHLTRLIKKYDLDMIFFAGPGHGAPGVLAPVYLEGTYSEVYSDKSEDEAGLRGFFKQFSFPGGIGSHCTPETPGSIHEGGELGYVLSHACGAAFDNPELIVAAVVGDGESETGPLATSWHINKFLNPIRDGAVLPVLHLNGYKINNPTLLARISHEELDELLHGYGWTPYFVEGSDPDSMHQAMAATTEHCVQEIRACQKTARRTGVATRVRWPMIVLRTPKGWTAPAEVAGHRLEGFWRAHQVPMADVKKNPDRLHELEKWMRSYKPEELFDAKGRLLAEVEVLAPTGARRMSANTLRLWSAAASNYFDFQEFSSGDFANALAGTLAAESVTRVLSPDDSTSKGQGLRFLQEYFLVACSLADIVRRFRQNNTDSNKIADAVAIQLNDTHPAMAVPELLRILLDEEHLEWDAAWELTQKTLAYTNHTLLPEALEKWPLEWFEVILPRHLEIMFEINRRLLDEVRRSFPGNEQRVERVSLVEESSQRTIRMANLAIVGSHSTNGVAALHSDLLRTTTVKDLAEVFPGRFNNKTNGVTPRRWLLLANPALARTITEAIGDGWVTDLDQLENLLPLAEDSGFRDAIRKAKSEAKSHFVNWLRATSGQSINLDSIFHSQVKGIHEYKRQLLNALRVVVLYNRVRENPNLEMTPQPFSSPARRHPLTNWPN